jgi:hypothetical protein
MTREPLSIDELIDLLGGTSEVARQLGLASPSVSGWRKDNSVPARQHARLLALCVQVGVPWRPPGWPPQVQLRFNPRVAAAA